MALPITLLYVILTLLSPADLIPSLYPYRPMIVLSAIGLLGCVLTLAVDPRVLAAPQMLLLLGFFGMLCVSRIMNGWYGGAYEAVLQFSVEFISCVLIAASANSQNKVRWIGTGLIFVAFYYAVNCTMALSFGIAREKFVLEQWLGTDALTGDPTYLYRTKGLGLVEDPNDLAQVYLTAMPFLWLLWRNRNFVWNFLVVLIPTSFLFFAIYQTSSRGALVGIFVLLALLLKDKMGFAGPVVSAGFAAFLLLVVGFGGGRTVSATSDSGGGRLGLWSEALGLFRGSPIWGIGYETITSHMPLTAHNSWVLCLTETGILGFFFWVGMLVVSVSQLRSIIALKEEDPKLVRLARAMLLSLSAWMATAWFLSRTYSILLYVLLGLAAALWVEAKRTHPTLPGLTVSSIVRRTGAAMVASYLAIYFMVRLHWGG
jgi:putative inorganic carbon (hco3(-)) transporter